MVLHLPQYFFIPPLPPPSPSQILLPFVIKTPQSPPLFPTLQFLLPCYLPLFLPAQLFTQDKLNIPPQLLNQPPNLPLLIKLFFRVPQPTPPQKLSKTFKYIYSWTKMACLHLFPSSNFTTPIPSTLKATANIHPPTQVLPALLPNTYSPCSICIIPPSTSPWINPTFSFCLYPTLQTDILAESNTTYFDNFDLITLVNLFLSPFTPPSLPLLTLFYSITWPWCLVHLLCFVTINHSNPSVHVLRCKSCDERMKSWLLFQSWKTSGSHRHGVPLLSLVWTLRGGLFLFYSYFRLTMATN